MQIVQFFRLFSPENNQIDTADLPEVIDPATLSGIKPGSRCAVPGVSEEE